MPQLLAWPTAETAQASVAEQAAKTLRRGGLVVYPTDTVYGLGADASSATAINRIYEVKGRPDEKAIIWLVSSVDDVRAVCAVDQRVERLAARFWPGALTIVLPRLGSDQRLLTLGVRIPAHPAALSLIRALGRAVATTSANRSGQPSARTATQALAQIGDGVDLIIDAGPTPGGTESTVVDLSTEPGMLLRAGAIGRDEIEAALGNALALPLSC